MISNEQRAHDYAITMLNRAVDDALVKNDKLNETDKKSNSVDSFEIYLDIYNRSLEKLNNQ